MSTHELLRTCRQAGIDLAVDGDDLYIDAPIGALTPELRAELVRHKPVLLQFLAAPVTQFVSLKGGMILPLPAVLLALDLERRGFRMSLDTGLQFQIEPASTLTEADLVAIDRWKLHLSAILSDADAHERVQ